MDFSGTGTRVVTDRQIALPGSVAAIGAFDGVHRGHQHLIRAAIRDARARGVREGLSRLAEASILERYV